jgi:hypothetical protein
MQPWITGRQILNQYPVSFPEFLSAIKAGHIVPHYRKNKYPLPNFSILYCKKGIRILEKGIAEGRFVPYDDECAKERIQVLKKRLAEVEDHTWADYELPSDPEERKAHTDKLMESHYKTNDVEACFLTNNAVQDWINCKVLLDAVLKGFELFRLFAAGRLHPYDPDNGYRIVDRSTCYRKQTLQEILRMERIEEGTKGTWSVIGAKSYGPRPVPRTDQQIYEDAQRKFEKQQADIFDVPNGCIAAAFSLSKDPKVAKRQIDEASRWIVPLDEVMAMDEIEDIINKKIRKDNELKTHISKSTKAPQPKPLSPEEPELSVFKAKSKKWPNIVAKIRTPDGIEWSDIKITFLSDEEILVQYLEEHAERRFNTAGFEDGRNGNPIMSWELFHKSASKKAIPFNMTDRKKIEKTVQILNEKLSGLFPDLSQNPIQLNKEKDGYYFPFQIMTNA